MTTEAQREPSENPSVSLCGFCAICGVKSVLKWTLVRDGALAAHPL